MRGPQASTIASSRPEGLRAASSTRVGRHRFRSAPTIREVGRPIGFCSSERNVARGRQLGDDARDLEHPADEPHAGVGSANVSRSKPQTHRRRSASSPATMSRNVVLPAPLGPMRQTLRRRRGEVDPVQSRCPRTTLRCRAGRRLARPGGGQRLPRSEGELPGGHIGGLVRATTVAQDRRPRTAEADDDHENTPREHVPAPHGCPEVLGPDRMRIAREEGRPPSSPPADREPHQHTCRQRQPEHRRGDEPGDRRVQGSRDGRHRRAQDERDRPRPNRVDAGLLRPLAIAGRGDQLGAEPAAHQQGAQAHHRGRRRRASGSSW